MTQKEKILWHLKTHGHIDTMTAIKEYWITRLSEMIRLLREDGYKITPVWEYNQDKKWVRYYLIKERIL
jgi:hypothetical protein